jgi:hypothetical protein
MYFVLRLDFVRLVLFDETRCIVILPLIEILTKIINHTNKVTDLKALHPVLNNLSQIFGGIQGTTMTGFLPVSTCRWFASYRLEILAV